MYCDVPNDKAILLNFPISGIYQNIYLDYQEEEVVAPVVCLRCIQEIFRAELQERYEVWEMFGRRGRK